LCSTIVNLIFKDGLKKLLNAVNNIRESVLFIKSTPSRKQMFEKLIQLENIQVKVLPSKDVPTRWNSTYLMLKSLVP